jgi:hypothetical protein
MLLFVQGHADAACNPPETSGPLTFFRIVRLTSAPPVWSYLWVSNYGLPLLEDCTKASVDDYDLNVSLSNLGGAITLGIRVTLPSGVVRTNFYSGPWPGGNWFFEDRIDDIAGDRKIELVADSIVTHTKYVNVTPYTIKRIPATDKTLA